MKYFIFVLLLLPLSIQASGEIKRGGYDGDIIAWRSASGACFVLDIKNLKTRIPSNWSPAFGVLRTGLNPMRALTDEEVSVCNDTPLKHRSWRVAPNNGLLTRPVKLVTDGVRISVASPRATVGNLCSQITSTYDVTLTDTTSWRRVVVNQKAYAAVCELK